MKSSQYSTEVLATLLTLKLPTDDAKITSKRQKWANELAERYNHGTQCPQDPNKAKYYANIADIDLAKANYQQTSSLSTSATRNTHSWFHAIRLFFSRSLRVLSHLPRLNLNHIELLKPILPALSFANQALKPLIQSPIFKRIMGLGGMIYLANFAFDCGIVIKSTFSEPAPTSANLSQSIAHYWNRFKLVLNKDSRPSRMLNDLIWGVINSVSFLFLGPFMGAVINFAGFGFDLINESAKTAYQLAVIDNTKASINNHYKNDNSTISPTKSVILSSLKQHKLGVIRTRTKKVLCCLLLFVGMAMFYFSPLAPIAITGAAIALISGSLLNGLGERVWDFVKTKLNSKSTTKADTQSKLSTMKINSKLHSSKTTRHRTTSYPPPSKTKIIRSRASSIASSKQFTAPPRTAESPRTVAYKNSI